MFHLFKKIYLASDNVIDVNIDRVVISSTNGLDTLDVLKTKHGDLLAYGENINAIVGSGKKYSSVINMFDTLATKSNDTGKRVVIYADDSSLCTLLATWYKTILSNADKTACTNLVDNNVFRYDIFSKGRFSRNAGNTDLSSSIDVSGFGTAFDSVSVDSTEKSNFISSHKSGFSIEFLLASYLNDGSMKAELKDSIKNLMKKDLEKYLYELKEIFFTHLLTSGFTDKLSLAKTYDFNNFKDVLSDSTTYADLFLNSRIWKYKYMNFASTGENINFDSITSTDITNFKNFTNLSGETWSEETVYKQVKSDINKLDFLDIYTDFTDDRLTTLIDTEASFTNAAGSFFSIDLETVNHYFVQTILQNKSDTTFLSKYAI